MAMENSEMAETIDVRCNGEARTVAANATLADLVQAEGLDAGRVAVLVNGEVVRREERGQCRLRDGDAVEMLVFAGGG